MSSNVTKEIGAMSDEELSVVLSEALAPEAENPDTSEVSPLQPETETLPEAEQPESNALDQTVPPANEPDPVQTKLADLEKKLNAVLSANESLQNANVNLQRLNGHLSNKVGVLKREVPPLPTDADMLEKPVESTQRVVTATLETARVEQETRAAQRNQAIIQTFGIVSAAVPDFAEHIEDMAGILKEAGMPEDQLRLFRHNPVAAITDAPHLVHLAERAKLAKQVAALQQQLIEAKKAPQRMANSLQGAAAAAPAISSTTVRTGPKKSSAPPNFQNMSDKELEEFIKTNSQVAAEEE